MKQRIYYLDWLRVFATFAVVLIHITASYIPVLKESTVTIWHTSNVLNSMSRASVPIFFMISGSLLLGEKDMPIVSFYQKRVMKIAVPFLTWSLFYYLYGMNEGVFPVHLKKGLVTFFEAKVSTHLWFFYFLIGLYVIVPIIKPLFQKASRQHFHYFFFLWFIQTIFFKYLDYRYHFNLYYAMPLVDGYIGYFVLGYYLNRFPVKINKRGSISLFIIAYLYTMIITAYLTIQNGGRASIFWYEYLTINVLLMAIGLFLFSKYYLTNRPLPVLLQLFNQVSLGIYLIHPFLMRYVFQETFRSVYKMTTGAWPIVINYSLTLITSFIIASLLSKIPVIKKLV